MYILRPIIENKHCTSNYFSIRSASPRKAVILLSQFTIILSIQSLTEIAFNQSKFRDNKYGTHHCQLVARSHPSPSSLAGHLY